MTTVIKIHKDSFMFMTGVMSCLWHCHVSLMHTPSNKVLPPSVVITKTKNKKSVEKQKKCQDIIWSFMDIYFLLP